MYGPNDGNAIAPPSGRAPAEEAAQETALDAVAWPARLACDVHPNDTRGA